MKDQIKKQLTITICGCHIPIPVVGGALEFQEKTIRLRGEFSLEKAQKKLRKQEGNDSLIVTSVDTYTKEFTMPLDTFIDNADQ